MEGLTKELSGATEALIENAGGRAELAISAMSVSEAAMLEATGRITLSRSVDEWLASALTAPGLRLVELSPGIALESTRLPWEPHGDPADRIIIATARVLGATLVTCDDAILDYGAHGHVRVRKGRSRS
ncbi:MAG: type II toxin-antitoxin system VapC family toxin [Gemmatimonadetes bacterium]|nr:type II toxin-antitoxin system VapC family toxin [Gemmatimonadota bacterium]